MFISRREIPFGLCKKTMDVYLYVLVCSHNFNSISFSWYYHQYHFISSSLRRYTSQRKEFSKKAYAFTREPVGMTKGTSVQKCNTEK